MHSKFSAQVIWIFISLKKTMCVWIEPYNIILKIYTSLMMNVWNICFFKVTYSNTISNYSVHKRIYNSEVFVFYWNSFFMQCVNVFTGDSLASGISNWEYFGYHFHVVVLVYYSNWGQSIHLTHSKETFLY